MGKTARLEIRLSEAEKARLEQQAESEGTTPSALLRAALAASITRRPFLTPRDVESLDAVREEVRRVGVNLNVLLRSVHLEQHGMAPDGPRLADYQAMMVELQAVLDRLIRATESLAV